VAGLTPSASLGLLSESPPRGHHIPLWGLSLACDAVAPELCRSGLCVHRPDAGRMGAWWRVCPWFGKPTPVTAVVLPAFTATHNTATMRQLAVDEQTYRDHTPAVPGVPARRA
jgi:hypothetical protein